MLFHTHLTGNNSLQIPLSNTGKCEPQYNAGEHVNKHSHCGYYFGFYEQSLSNPYSKSLKYMSIYIHIYIYTHTHTHTHTHIHIYTHTHTHIYTYIYIYICIYIYTQPRLNLEYMCKDVNCHAVCESEGIEVTFIFFHRD